MSERIIQTVLTEDGSHTLYVPELDEHYHSVHGAVQESNHVFIKTGFHASDFETTDILEIGFGTGLNAILTLLEAVKLKKKVRYTTLEFYPLKKDLIEELNYPAKLSLNDNTEDYWVIQNASWLESEGEFTEVNEYFSIRKLYVDFTKFKFNDSYNLIYFDAFAPDKQPEMWDSNLFDCIASATVQDGVLTTYCAKGVVRRALIAAGFNVERLPGPPGKREMLRGRKK